jgi:hypothetical protein
MKTFKTFCILTILATVTFSCKKSQSPEPYSSYISIEIRSLASKGSAGSNEVQIYLKNDADKVFEKECIITYSLQDTLSGKYYTCEKAFFNKLIPNLPNGVLNIGKRNTLFINIDLQNLTWNGLPYDSLELKDYLFDVQLQVRDPYSPMNLIHSNRINITF